MKYSDAVKAMLIASINDLAADPEKYAVNSGKDFSRNRQLGFTQPARKRNEYSAFCQMADRAGADTPVIYLCDRGCASYNVFAHVIENSQFFLIRCTDVKTEKILGFPLDKATELDYHADRILSRPQSKKKRLHSELAGQYRYVCRDVPMDYITEERTEYDISPRVIRIEISKGCYENLITNQPGLDFDIEDFKDLYHLRWDEETSFRDLKYPLCLKAFHSKKYEYIVQEVWARAILYNFCTEIAMDVEIPRKYVYQANYSSAMKICRDFLRVHDERIVFDAEGLTAKNIEPVRPGRTFARQAGFKLPMSFCYRN